MKHVKRFLMGICVLSIMITLSANPVQRVSQALEDTKNVSIEAPFIGNAFNTISSAHAYEASLGFNIPEIYWDIGVRKYVLKDKGVLTFFSTEHEMFTSNEFLASIHNDFCLKSIEDGLLFQELLYAIDGSYSNDGFFIQGNSWIFIRDEFFGDIEAWIVETDGNGAITSISFEYEADVNIPEETYRNEDMGFAYDNFPSAAISEEDIAQIKEALGKDLVYELEVAPIKSRWLVQLSEANWYNCEISIFEQYEDMTSTSIYELLAFENNGEVSFFEESNEFIASPTFLKSIKESFVLRDEISIEDFELALDQINDYERKEKARFERNGLFVFIRKEPFDDGHGFIVRTNDLGIITGIEYSNEIPLEGVEVPVEEFFDESTVVWTFSLLEPDSKNMQFPHGENIPVTIEFNEWAANKVGAWIGTFQDGEFVGMYAGTDITSPFDDMIPGEYLNIGENIISYRLLRPGADYDNPIAEIDLAIWIGD